MGYYKTLYKKLKDSVIEPVNIASKSLAAVSFYKNKMCLMGLNELRKRHVRKSNTCFILGSGPSINDITNDEWAEIKKNDSIGFNFWTMHDFVPDLYVAQDRVGTDLFYSMFIGRKNEYADKKILIRGGILINKEIEQGKLTSYLATNLKKQLYIVPEFAVNSRSIISPMVYLYLWSFLSKVFTAIVPVFGGSVTYMVSMCYMLGYEKVVLCGIDMNDRTHFYDSESYRKRFNRVPRFYNNAKEIHPHANGEIRKYTIANALKIMEKFYSKRRSMFEIYTVTKKSKLYPEFKLYDFLKK